MKKKQILALIPLAMKISFNQLLLAALFFCNVYAKEIKGQEILNKRISFSVKNTEVKKVLNQIELLADVKFVYSSKNIDLDHKVTINAREKKIK